MAALEVKVPDIGDFKDVEVIEVLVKPGDRVAAEQSLVTVESDKASMEIPSSHAGVVKEMKVALGDKVNQGVLVLVLEAAGAGAPAGAVAAAAGAEGDEAGAGTAPPSLSSTSNGDPSLILSPSLTRSSFTTPAALDGISIDALSLSTVTSDCSALIRSPGLTSTSMISTSLKSPMSGTFTSTVAIARSLRRRAG